MTEAATALASAELMRDNLAADFPSEALGTLRKSGTNLTYIPISEVINRMNRIVGIDNWSTEIISVKRDGTDTDWIIAWVRVTVRIGDKVVTKDGVGGQQIKFKKDSTDPVDLGDEFKGAVSDATKKALQQLGVGLYLARDEESIALDETEYASEEDKEHDALWEVFMGHVGNMTDDEKDAIRAWWDANHVDESGEARKMSKKSATTDEIKGLIAQVGAVRLGGTVVEEPPG